jgi:large subunit ribosomal protein L20
MPRVKRGTTALKRRHKILKQTKGFRFDLGNKERAARTAILHAGVHAFRGRRDKKGDFRRLWNIQINAAVRPLGLSYSKFINTLKQKNVLVNRKMIASLAQENPEAFSRLMEQVKA